MSKKLRQEVYDKFNGHCSYCGKEISLKEMQVDHMIPKRIGYIADDVDSIENLTPSCRRCNHYKRARTVEGFRQLMITLHDRIAADYITKVAIDYGIATIKPFDGVFYFEKRCRDEAREEG